MSLIVCVCDFWSKQKYYKIERCTNELKAIEKKYIINSLPDDEKPDISPDDEHLPKKPLKRLILTIEGITAFYLLREIQIFTEFRRALCLNPTLQSLDVLWLQLKPTDKEIIDYKWNSMVQRTLWIHIELEILMSWLSTLGGGFSALGEQFKRCAETAGKISLRQLNIGLSLGDPFLQARCKLFYSISLIQTGRLRAAKHLIRKQYEFAQQHKEHDGRLVKMCKGIWLRLQYEYGLRLQSKKR